MSERVGAGYDAVAAPQQVVPDGDLSGSALRKKMLIDVVNV